MSTTVTSVSIPGVILQGLGAILKPGVRGSCVCVCTLYVWAVHALGVIIWALGRLSLEPAAPAGGWSKSGCFGSEPLQTSDGSSDLAINPGGLIAK